MWKRFIDMDFHSEGMSFSTADIWEANFRIKPYISRTPLVYSKTLSKRLGCSLYMKMECWQVCGCFKVRGAVNKVASLNNCELEKGLVTTSSGNHAIATAFAASLFNNPRTTVFMPQNADPTKIEKVRSYGLDPVLHGNNYLEAYDQANEYCRREGATYVHSHADPMVIAGQGTIGLEIMEDIPDLDVVVVPIGGGGLVSGISTAVKSLKPAVRVIGVEPAAAPSAFMSLRDGKCYERIDIKPSMADGLLGGIGKLPFEVIKQCVEQVIVLEEDEIGRGVAVFQQDEQLMIEASAAAGLASLLSGKWDLTDKKVVLILTSRNIDAAKFNEIIKRYG